MARFISKKMEQAIANTMFVGSMLAFGGYCFYRLARDEPEYGNKPAAAAPKTKEEPIYAINLPAETFTIKEKPAENLPYRTVKAVITAYCPEKCCCGPGAKGLTSTGKSAYKFDGVAVDPDAIPYHSKIEIPGVGIKEADDTGGAMRQDWKKGIYHFDVRMSDHEEAKKFGKHENVEVRIYDKK